MHIAFVVFTTVLSASSALVRPVPLNGPIAELNVAAMEITNATATIQSAASLAPASGRDQAAAAVLLEIEQHVEDLAQEAHALWVNARTRQARARLQSVREIRTKASDPKSQPSVSVAALSHTGSIVYSANARKTDWNRGNLTVVDVYSESLEKPRSNKGKSVPGLQKAMAIVLQAIQHVQSAAKAEVMGKGDEDIIPTAQLLMDRSRELYKAVEVATAGVAGGKDAQIRAEEKLEKVMQRVAKQSSALGDDTLTMSRELRLIKHAVREAVGGSSRGDVKRAAREALKDRPEAI